MKQVIFYFFLDTLATMVEVYMLYTCNTIFCKKCQMKVLGFIPYLVIFFLTCVMTWVIPLGTVKIITLFVTFLFLQRLILKEKWYKLIMAYSLYFMLMFLNDYSALIVADVIFGYTSIMAGNIVVNIWQQYLMKIIILCFIIAFLSKVFRKFVYELQPRDAALFLLYNIITYFIIYYSMGHGYFSGNVNWFNSMIGLSGLLLGCLFLLLFLYQKNSTYLRCQKDIAQQEIRELELKYEYYKEKQKDEEKVRSVYHDMKNHLLVLQKQINSPETAEMVEKLQSQVAMYEDYEHTGNDILDIILKEKSETARERNIALSVIVNLNDVDFIEPLDISTIFGNGLDNAIEASEKLPEEQRAILVKAGKMQNFFSVRIENNCLQNSRNTKNRTTKADDFLHGFGISNMRKAVEKYDGQLTIKCENGKFTLKILIPIP